MIYRAMLTSLIVCLAGQSHTSKLTADEMSFIKNLQETVLNNFNKDTAKNLYDACLQEEIKLDEFLELYKFAFVNDGAQINQENMEQIWRLKRACLEAIDKMLMENSL